MENGSKKQESSTTHVHGHVHHCCWIHKGNKPIEKYTSPDLQLQLGPWEQMDELFNLTTCLLILQ